MRVAGRCVCLAAVCAWPMCVAGRSVPGTAFTFVASVGTGFRRGLSRRSRYQPLPTCNPPSFSPDVCFCGNLAVLTCQCRSGNAACRIRPSNARQQQA
jgi:hypothetical protein